jgi:hypothetical protein
MGEFEKERFEKMQLGIIKTELRKAYVNYYNGVQQKADFLKQKTMNVKKLMCNHLVNAVRDKLGNIIHGHHDHDHDHSHSHSHSHMLSP